MSYNKEIQSFIEEYRRDVKDGPLASRQIAAWLLREKKWAPTTDEAIDILTRHVSYAMRTQFTIDPDGRRVRRKHAVRYSERRPNGTYTQTTFWYDKDIAPPQFMLESFQQRRAGAADVCWQIKQDLDSYNKFDNKGAPLQISFDFRDDMEERELSARDPNPPSDTAEEAAEMVNAAETEEDD
jgi:hypothetical protein